MAVRAFALACVPVLGIAAIPLALLARRRINRDLSPGGGLAVGALAVACLWLFVTSLYFGTKDGPARNRGQLEI